MERKLVDVGHRVETEPGLVSDMTHAAQGSGEVGGTVGTELAKGGAALQAALRKAVAAVGNGIQDGRDEVIASARKEPMTAVTAAAAFGLLVGFALAMGSRSGAGRRTSWLPQLNSSRTSFLGRRASSGWRGFLRLE